MYRKKPLEIFLTYFFAIIVLFLFIGPFLWLVISSISPEVELTSIPLHWFPERPNLNNYKTLLFGLGNNIAAKEYLPALRNSTVVAVMTTFICLVMGAVAAYAFSRIKFRGRNVLLLSTLLIQLLPTIAIIIPLFLVVGKLGMLNSLRGLVLVYCSFTLPFVIWVMKGYFDTIPVSLEEAALIDGCSRFGTLIRIVLPLSLPGFAATAIFSILTVWSEFFIAVVFTSSISSKTIPVVIAEFNGRFALNYGLMAAASVLACVPPIIFGLLTQKYLISGLTSGGVKG